METSLRLGSIDNNLLLFHVDTSSSYDKIYSKAVPLPNAHNVVWDRKRQVLWSASNNRLFEFEYNFDCQHPHLTVKNIFSLPGNNAHDLFPAYGKDSLWLTNPTGVYTIDLKTKKVSEVQTSHKTNIKSVSSGPSGYPAIIKEPQAQWWSDEVLDLQGNVIFKKSDFAIYKARWLLPNLFSYPAEDMLKICN